MSQSCDRIVYGLRQQGYMVHLVHFTNRESPDKYIALAAGSYLAVPVWENEAHTLMWAWKKLEGMANQWDGLVVFGGHLPILAAPVYAKWLNLPLVVFLRGNDFDSGIFSSRKRQFLSDALNAAQMVFSVSNRKLDLIKKLFPTVNFCYIPNGIDLTNWITTNQEQSMAQKWKADLASSKILAGCFGHLKAKKGIDLVLKAAVSPLIRDNYHFLLIGELETGLQEQLTEAGLNYTLLPFKDRFELITYYEACDVVLLPSYYDGMPNVLMEAGALGCLILGAETDGIADVLQHEINGLTFKPGDVNALREKLIQIYRMEFEDKIRFGQQLKETIYENYTLAQEIGKYDEAFSKI